MTKLLLLGSTRMTLKAGVPAPAELEPYRRQDGSYSFPICGDIARRLLKAFPDLEVDDDLMDIFYKINEWQETSLEIASMKDIESESFDLYPYQRVGVEWLLHVKRGILADEQGLGKTVQAVVAARRAAPERGLVICTISKLDDWYTHLVYWYPETKVIIMNGNAESRKKVLSEWEGFIVCGYDAAYTHRRELSKTNLVIVDEAHKIRNRKSGSKKKGPNTFFEGVRVASKNAEYVFLVTASPTVNLSGDIWTLLSICDKNRFASYWGFVFRFCEVKKTGFGLKVGGVRSDEKENLERIISPYLIMREGMLGLPKPIMRVFEYEMPPEQKALYDEMDRIKFAEFNGEIMAASTELSLITRLRQLALSPRLIFSEYNGPSKVDVVEGIVNEREGKVVIFAMYSSLVYLTVEALNAAGIETVPYTGEMTKKVQGESLAAFRRGSARVIVLTHGVGGEGLDLYEADREIFLELAWHPAGNQHALRRILRHGQKSETVEIIVVLTLDSVEKHMWDIIEAKGEITIKELMRRREGGENIV